MLHPRQGPAGIPSDPAELGGPLDFPATVSAALNETGDEVIDLPVGHSELVLVVDDEEGDSRDHVPNARGLRISGALGERRVRSDRPLFTMLAAVLAAKQ